MATHARILTVSRVNNIVFDDPGMCIVTCNNINHVIQIWIIVRERIQCVEVW